MRVFKKISGFLICGIAWTVITTLKQTPALPTLKDILKTLIKLLATIEYLKHIQSSLFIVFCGILIAVVFGFISGALVYEFKLLKQIVMPVIDSIRGISGLTLLPLLIILVGIDAPSRIIVIFWTAWPAIMLSTIHSLEIDKSIVEAASLDGASRLQMMKKVRIPVASSGIMTGIRIGASGGWISLIAAEMLGATSGLGYFLLYSSQAFLFTNVYATIIVIAALGGGLNLILSLIQKSIKNKRTGGKNEKSVNDSVSNAICDCFA